MAYDMAMELLRAQTGHGLNIDWALVSLAGLMWADGILQTMLELGWRQGRAGQMPGGFGCWHCVTASSGQCSSLSMLRSGIRVHRLTAAGSCLDAAGCTCDPPAQRCPMSMQSGCLAELLRCLSRWSPS